MTNPHHIVVPPGTKLDLGSGPRPVEGFRGVDEQPITDYEVSFDTGLPWPFEDDSIEALRASHVIEHIDLAYTPEWAKAGRVGNAWDVATPGFELSRNGWIEMAGWRWAKTGRRKDLLFHFFDEAYRVIKPGGTFEVRWPNVQHVNATGDPTHRRQISAKLLHYLSVEGRKAAGVEWYVVSCNWEGSVYFQTNQQQLVELGEKELGEKTEREWNGCEETMMLLEARK